MTDILPTKAASIILMQQIAPQMVRIVTDNGNPLGRVQIFNMQGKILVSQEVRESSYTFRAPTPGIYIVRVNGETKKLGIKL
jgi:hypothetical protein